MAENMNIATKTTLWESLKSFDMKSLMHSIRAYPIDWIEVGAAAGVGIASGFLFKKYCKQFIFLLAGGIILIALLDRFNFAHIDWTAFQSIVDINFTREALTRALQTVTLLVKMNIQALVSFCVGFILGFKFA